MDWSGSRQKGGSQVLTELSVNFVLTASAPTIYSYGRKHTYENHELRNYDKKTYETHIPAHFYVVYWRLRSASVRRRATHNGLIPRSLSASAFLPFQAGAISGFIYWPTSALLLSQLLFSS